MTLPRPMLAAIVALMTAAAGCASGGVAQKSTTGTPGSTTSSSSTGGKAGACVPGEQIACACPGGAQGAQVCMPDGAGYAACTGCDDVTASSSAGTGDGASVASSAASSGAGGASAAGAGGASAAGAGGASSAGSSGAGGAPVPCSGGPTEIDLGQVTLYANPPDLAAWPVTTTLTEVDFTNDGVHVEFSKQDGADRWPDVVPPGWGGPLQYTIGMAECIGGQWYASAVIEVWYGLPAAGGNVAVDDQIAMNWYYDPVRWGLLAGRQPATGEMVGIFVAAGNLRNVTSDDPAQSTVMERSNVVLVPMPDVNGATHAF